MSILVEIHVHLIPSEDFFDLMAQRQLTRTRYCLNHLEESFLAMCIPNSGLSSYFEGQTVLICETEGVTNTSRKALGMLKQTVPGWSKCHYLCKKSLDGRCVK